MLHCDPKSVSVCLALPIAYTPTYRNQIAEILFEYMGVKSIFLASQTLLSGFSSGRPSCLVIDSGYSYTSIYGIHDLYPERSTELIYSFGGRDIDAYLMTLAGAQLKECTPADINYIKSHFCTVASKPLSESTSQKSAIQFQTYQLPDGQELKLSTELELAPELIFNSALNGHTKKPTIYAAIQKALARLSAEKSSAILKNIICSGGNFKFKGLEARLRGDLSKSTAWNHPSGDLGVWRGGAIFASMPTFSSMAFSAKRWREHGEIIIQKKWL